MNILEQPFYDPNPERSERRVWDQCQADGKASYMVGISFDKCPPYRVNDFAVSWQMGWRHAHEAHFTYDHKEARKRCHKDCLHGPYCPFCKRFHEGGDTCMGHYP